MTKAERQAREYGDEEPIADEERAAHIAEYLQMSGWQRAAAFVLSWQADSAKLRAERQHAQTSTLPGHDAEAPRTVRARIAPRC